MTDAKHSEHRVVFTPSGLSGLVADGTSVLVAARQLGVDLDSVCGGRGICGRCQFSPTFGSFPKWEVDSSPEALDPPAAIEEHYSGSRPLAEGNRLGCAALIRADVLVDVPRTSQIHKQVVRKDLDTDGRSAGSFDVDPVIDLFYIEVPEPELGHTVSEIGLIREQLAFDWSLEGLTVDPRLLSQVHEVLRTDRRRVTVVVDLLRHEIAGLRPGYVDTVYGLAVDIGSTTIAGYLCDLDRGEIVASGGTMNPQIRFGEDLMSRVSHAMTTDDGAAELTTVVRRALDELVGDLVAGANVDATVGLTDGAGVRVGVGRADVVEIVVVGNPIMHHLLLGIDPSPLGVAPFTLATAESVRTTAVALDLDCPEAFVYVLPCIGGHIGADTVAAILAVGLHQSDQPRLLVDVGTNAEIVLTDGERLFAASSPTGPALEGAQISCGVRAVAGAIERIRIDPVTLEPRFKVIGCEPWSDEPGYADATAGLDIVGVCGSGIIETIGQLFLAGILAPDGTIRDRREQTPRLVADGRTFAYVLQSGNEGTGPELRFTQADVRAIQLAKAALRAGIDLLCERAQVDRVDQIGLAGAFGSHIDPLAAILLGLAPDGPPTSVVSVGNAAGAGAVAALLSGTHRAEAERIAEQVQRVETATEARFQELFVAAMAIPHADPTPILASHVELPVLDEASEQRTANGRRRQRRRQPQDELPQHEPRRDAGQNEREDQQSG